MSPSSSDQESTKIHGDKLEVETHESHNTVTPPRSALDQLEIPPHEAPQHDGGAKLHGDKLEPHSTGEKS